MHSVNPLLPVLFVGLTGTSGYWFLTHFYPTKYYALRAGGFHIASRSTLFGFLLLLLAFALADFLEHVCFGAASVLDLRPSLDSVDHRLNGGDVLLVALILPSLASLLPPLLNLLFSSKYWAVRAASLRGDFLEVLLASATAQDRMVEIVLKNGKSYVGYPLESGLLCHQDGYLRLHLLVSGFRDSQTKALNITTYYETFGHRLDEDLRRSLPTASYFDGGVGGSTPSYSEHDDLIVTVPVAEVLSARLFDMVYYESVFRAPEIEEP